LAVYIIVSRMHHHTNIKFQTASKETAFVTKEMPAEISVGMTVLVSGCSFQRDICSFTLEALEWHFDITKSLSKHAI